MMISIKINLIEDSCKKIKIEAYFSNKTQVDTHSALKTSAWAC